MKRSFKILSRSGFTLLEAIVSVVLFGLLILAVASMWDVCWRATEQITRGGGAKKQPDVVLERLREAVEASVFHAQPQSLYAWHGTDDRSGAEEADRVSFVTTLPLDAAELSSEFAPLERMMVSVRQESNGKRSLVMQVGPFTMNEDDWQRETVLLANVAAFRVRYWDEDRKDWVDGWNNEDHAPAAVQFGIVLAGEPSGLDFERWAHRSVVRVYPSPEEALLSTALLNAITSSNAVQQIPPPMVPNPSSRPDEGIEP